MMRRILLEKVLPLDHAPYREVFADTYGNTTSLTLTFIGFKILIDIRNPNHKPEFYNKFYIFSAWEMSCLGIGLLLFQHNSPHKCHYA